MITRPSIALAATLAGSFAMSGVARSAPAAADSAAASGALEEVLVVLTPTPAHEAESVAR